MLATVGGVHAQPDLSWKLISPTVKQSLIKSAPDLSSDFSIDSSGKEVCLNGDFSRVCGIPIPSQKAWTPIAGPNLSFDQLRTNWLDIRMDLNKKSENGNF